MTITQQLFDAKWICNGFPKSGTHLLTMMVNPVARLQEASEGSLITPPWAGTFAGNSWTAKRIKIEKTCYKLGRIENGRSVKAHLGHDERLEEFIYLLSAAHIFIYRDLRDVAVSQAYHIINSSDESLAHPRPSAYPLDDFDKVLELVISGHEEFPGIVSRWEYFAPWLKVDWVLPVKYRYLRNEPKKAAKEIFKYGILRNARTWDRRVSFDQAGLEAVSTVMASTSSNREKSPTFRRGIVGEWEEVFTDRHREAWIRSDPTKWLARLGFEQEEWYD